MKFVVGIPRRTGLLRRLRRRWVKNMNMTYDVILVSQNGIQCVCEHRDKSYSLKSMEFMVVAQKFSEKCFVSILVTLLDKVTSRWV